MRRTIQGLVLGAVGLLLVSLWAGSLRATLKHKKETGKKCTFCHTGIPEPGDEDPQLTEDGKEFKRNNYKLTDKQKQKPDPELR